MDSSKWYISDMECKGILKFYLFFVDDVAGKEIDGIKSANKMQHLKVSITDKHIYIYGHIFN